MSYRRAVKRVSRNSPQSSPMWFAAAAAAKVPPSAFPALVSRQVSISLLAISSDAPGGLGVLFSFWKTGKSSQELGNPTIQLTVL